MCSLIDLKEKAINLRRSGHSYSSIIKTLGLKSKGTLSEWFKNLKLSKRSKDLLLNNNMLSHKRGLLTANKNRKFRIDTENEKSFLDGQKQINSLTHDDLLLIGTSLYWAEGTKSENRKNRSLAFSNSDPRMVYVYMRFVREVLKIPEDRIRAGIHIYPSISEELARSFWSDTTKLPVDRFYIVTQISRASQNKRPFNLLPYGTAVIRVNKRMQFYKVKGMISGIIERLSI